MAESAPEKRRPRFGLCPPVNLMRRTKSCRSGNVASATAKAALESQKPRSGRGPVRARAGNLVDEDVDGDVGNDLDDGVDDGVGDEDDVGDDDVDDGENVADKTRLCGSKGCGGGSAELNAHMPVVKSVAVSGNGLSA